MLVHVRADSLTAVNMCGVEYSGRRLRNIPTRLKLNNVVESECHTVRKRQQSSVKFEITVLTEYAGVHSFILCDIDEIVNRSGHFLEMERINVMCIIPIVVAVEILHAESYTCSGDFQNLG
jgi:hypothetical protein